MRYIGLVALLVLSLGVQVHGDARSAVPPHTNA